MLLTGDRFASLMKASKVLLFNISCTIVQAERLPLQHYLDRNCWRWFLLRWVEFLWDSLRLIQSTVLYSLCISLAPGDCSCCESLPPLFCLCLDSNNFLQYRLLALQDCSPECKVSHIIRKMTVLFALITVQSMS